VVLGQRQDDAGAMDVANRRRLGPDAPLELGALGGREADQDRADEGHARPLPERQHLGQQNGEGFARSCTEHDGASLEAPQGSART
jgi:hypothetical protein